MRSIHSVVMCNGKILLVAGSGNDPTEFAAGTFMSAVYNPANGSFKTIPTPDDFFCAGHVQLPDGKVLILGGNKAYPNASDHQQYEGLNTSYIFNPVTDRYVRENNLNDGHWYPPATVLGNGDVISYGGLNGTGTGGSVTIEYFKYNPSAPGGTDGQWPPANQINQQYQGWGLLPNGQVLETGGGLTDRENPVWEAAMYNPATNKFTPMAYDPIWRGYHSESYLLPDGRVMSIGSNPGDGSFDLHISVYSPPYLFHGARPQIESVAYPKAWHYGNQYNITVNQQITSAELIRPAAVTHQSDPNQRYVALPMSVHGHTVGLNVTNNRNIAPPGWYMLFVTNANGVPSVAKWVHVS